MHLQSKTVLRAIDRLLARGFKRGPKVDGWWYFIDYRVPQVVRLKIRTAKVERINLCPSRMVPMTISKTKDE